VKYTGWGAMLNAFVRRCAVLRFNRFQDANGGEISLGFLLQAAFADCARGGYAEIAGNGW
jgi:hypothetical protein